MENLFSLIFGQTRQHEPICRPPVMNTINTPPILNIFATDLLITFCTLEVAHRQSTLEFSDILRATALAVNQY